MTEPPTADLLLDVCDACGGTGIEEGREWDGQPCFWCKGAKFVRLDPRCPVCGPTDEPCEHYPTARDFL